jgi:2-amino-4-hydroxy-6-hydroxymethyldihydropteridine diphosphokinase
VTPRATALVGVGANLGDRRASLAAARDGMGDLEDTRVVACSSVYESTAVGAPGPNFFNAVVVLDTGLSAGELLTALHGIEAAMGRARRERWGPRVIDLDLLAWIPTGERASIASTGDVELPHPRMTARDFVLVPLHEVWPQLELDGLGVAEHIARLAPGARSIVVRHDGAL